MRKGLRECSLRSTSRLRPLLASSSRACVHVCALRCRSGRIMPQLTGAVDCVETHSGATRRRHYCQRSPTMCVANPPHQRHVSTSARWATMVATSVTRARSFPTFPTRAVTMRRSSRASVARTSVDSCRASSKWSCFARVAACSSGRTLLAVASAPSRASPSTGRRICHPRASRCRGAPFATTWPAYLGCAGVAGSVESHHVGR